VSKINSLAAAVLRWPPVWGALASLSFYVLIDYAPLPAEFVDRYFEGHPVEYLAMTMFFIGLAALVLKGIGVAHQFWAVDRPTLGPTPADGQPLDDVPELLNRLKQSGAGLADSYLVRRLREALEYIQRKGSADSLDEHLRYAADLDAARMHSSYALVRIIIWAIPILGFLGTVIGITLAIAKLGPQDLETSLPAVVSGLKVAFDTTALALALSIVLMFAQFITDRFETRLLAEVDQRTGAELIGRFEELGAATDPQAASVRRMAEGVIAASEKLVERQAAVWQKSIEAAQQHWQQATTGAGEQLQTALSGALEESLQRHAAALRESEQQVAERGQRQWKELRASVSDSMGALSASLDKHAARLGEIESRASERTRAQVEQSQRAVAEITSAFAEQHEHFAEQGEVLLRVIEAVSQIKTLEASLNDNLAALAKEHNFEETVMSLSAAIQLLTAQLRGSAESRSRVELRGTGLNKDAA